MLDHPRDLNSSKGRLVVDATNSRHQIAMADLAECFKRAPDWARLSWTDLRLRYRRSLLGPLWMTLSTGVLVAGLGIIWSLLFGVDLSESFPTIASGLILWLFLSGIVTESTELYLSAKPIMEAMALPVSSFAVRLCLRQVFTLSHNLLIFVVVAIVFAVPISWNQFLLLPGLLLTLTCAFWLIILFGILGARFRDLKQLVSSFVPLLMFLTPVVWQPEMLGKHAWLAYLNPFTHFIEISRAPLLGQTPDPVSIYSSVGLTLFVGLAAFLIFRRYRGRVVFWV